METRYVQEFGKVNRRAPGPKPVETGDRQAGSQVTGRPEALT